MDYTQLQYRTCLSKWTSQRNCTCWRSFKTFENFFACETESRWTDTDLDGVDGCRNNRQPHRRCTGDDVNLKDSSRQNNYNYHSSS